MFDRRRLQVIASAPAATTAGAIPITRAPAGVSPLVKGFVIMATKDTKGKSKRSSVAAVCRLLGSVARHSWAATLRLALLLVVIAACMVVIRTYVR